MVVLDKATTTPFVEGGGLVALSSEVNCRSVTHEFLHLAGLPDEYHENGNREVAGQMIEVGAYKCRSESPLQSIMGERDSDEMMELIGRIDSRTSQRVHVL